MKHINHNKDVNAWKSARSQIADHVNSMVSYVTSGKSADEIDWPSQTDDICFSELESIYTEVKTVGGDKCVIFVIDDNMQYRGMRYEYFKTCRKHEIPFGVAYFDIPIDSCIDRNMQRPQKISVDVIRKLNVQMEAPCEFKNNWERHVCVLNEIDTMDISCVERKILDLIKVMKIEPVMQQVADPTIAEQSRLETRKSFMHQADICMRKFVSNEMTLSKNRLSAASMKASSLKLNFAKKAVTSHLKMGYIDETNFFDEFGQIDLVNLESKICRLMSSEIT